MPRYSRRLAAAAAAALVLGGAGVAWAVIPDAGTRLIHGCYLKTTGALRVIDPSLGQKCASGEASLDWNQRGINWQGTWNASTAYVVNDAVALDGSSYIATRANTNSRPPSTRWDVLSAAGTAGPTGPTGPAGPSDVYFLKGPVTQGDACFDSHRVSVTGGLDLLNVNVPPGQYAIFGKAELCDQNTTPYEGAFCELKVGSTTLDRSDVYLRPLQSGRDFGGGLATVAMQSVFADPSNGRRFTLRCSGTGVDAADYALTVVATSELHVPN